MDELDNLDGYNGDIEHGMRVDFFAEQSAKGDDTYQEILPKFPTCSLQAERFAVSMKMPCTILLATLTTGIDEV